jgi:hypothetical protein
MPEVSKEVDVYNFGILLLEILTDKDPLKSTHLKEGLGLPQWLCSFVRKEWTAMVFYVEPREQQQKCGEQECMMRDATPSARQKMLQSRCQNKTYNVLYRAADRRDLHP